MPKKKAQNMVRKRVPNINLDHSEDEEKDI